MDWLEDDGGQQFFVLAGLAGTGKTTVMRHLSRSLVSQSCAAVFLAPTNKAAAVLCGKGVSARTIHKVLYMPVQNDDEDDVTFEFVPDIALSLDLIVIDEGSMVDASIINDLRSVNVRVLLVGDHGQLPPVGDNPKLMEDPDVVLRTIHRQSEGNPILDFAHHVREGHSPYTYEFAGDGLAVCPPGKKLKVLPRADVWLCWTNATRVGINKAILEMHGGQPQFVQIQMRSNWGAAGVYNGEVHRVEVLKWNSYGFPDRVRFEGGAVTDTHPSQWNRVRRLPFSSDRVMMDYGWAITTHSAQGSEWDHVVVIDESPFEDRSRWCYTAATRAAKTLVWMPVDALPEA